MGPLMRSQVAIRWFSCCATAVLIFASPTPVLAQTPAGTAPNLSAVQRQALGAAARDSTIPPWQREVMLGLSRGGSVSGGARLHSGESAPDRHAPWSPAFGATEPLRPENLAGGRVTLPRAEAPTISRGAASSGNLSDGSWDELPPIWLGGSSTIYDPIRDRIVVFGGRTADSYSNDVWALSLGGTPAWTTLTPTGTLPNARAYQSAIYDPVRDRMVIFGGYSISGSLNDVWVLSLGGTPAWTALTATGTPPNARSEHSAIYDPARDRMVVFGGREPPQSFNDVWVLSLAGTPAWTEETPTGTPPSARSYSNAIYDPVRDRMVIFGGFTEGVGDLNDVWTLSLTDTPAWTALAPAGTLPIPRQDPCVIYDPVRDRMVMFGGFVKYGSSGPVSDVWALSLADTPAWTELAPIGVAPSGGYAHSATYDPVRDRMVVLVGSSASGGLRLNIVCALSLAGTPAWTGMPPRARSFHSAIHDPIRDRMVVFGGYDSGILCNNDVWVHQRGRR
jgi:hypothetical protein